MVKQKKKNESHKKEKNMVTSKKKILISLAVILGVIMIFVGGCLLYLNDYYHADMEAINAFYVADDIKKEILEDNTSVYSSISVKEEIGFIFYPGGKVEYLAYEPLMETCATYGFLCVLVEMPFHLAVFDINAADGIQTQYPEIKKWYIGGHSLGGAMASNYLAENVEDFEGLILLGAYSNVDLSNTSLSVLSIYGSEDMVLNRQKYEQYKSNLPDNFTEFVISGGNHAYFGMYGEQDGDGTSTITNEEQVLITMEIIAKHLRK